MSYLKRKIVKCGVGFSLFRQVKHKIRNKRSLSSTVSTNTLSFSNATSSASMTLGEHKSMSEDDEKITLQLQTKKNLEHMGEAEEVEVAQEALEFSAQLYQQECQIKKYSLNDFNFLKVLGKGAYGKVMLAEKKGTDEVYAIKVLKKDQILVDYQVCHVLTEKKILTLGTMYPFLTTLYSCFQDKNRLFFVMEFVPGGELLCLFNNKVKIEEHAVKFYAAEVTLALQFLHKHGVIYRDLKLENVLLDMEGHCKLVDFGMCKEGIFDGATTNTTTGTCEYMAPELVLGKPYGTSVDWWSLGIMMYEMLIGFSPFDAEKDVDVYKNILNANLVYPNSLSRDAMDILKGFLTRSPSRRLGCIKSLGGETAILNHPFFSSIDWSSLERREVNPPFTPNIKDIKDASKFDIRFTNTEPNLTPVNCNTNDWIHQDTFEDFSFTNTKFNLCI